MKAIHRILPLLFVMITSFSGTCQTKKKSPVKTEPKSTKKYLGFDGLGANYFLDNNLLQKQDDTNKWEYKNIELGSISSVDFINPMTVLVFYQNFNTVILLDNQLNETRKINLSEIDSPQVANKVGLAAQNKFWVYTETPTQISLFDYTKSINLSIGLPLMESVLYTQTDFNYFYWIDENYNWYKMDFFGKTQLIANIPLFDTIQIVDENHIIYQKNKSIYCLDNKTKTGVELKNVEKSFDSFYYKDQILSIFTDQQIKKYKIKLP